VVCNISIADHHSTICTVKSTAAAVDNQHRLSRYRSFKHLNEAILQSNLSLVDWDSMKLLSDVNSMVSALTKALICVWDQVAPIVARRCRKKSTPWMTPETLSVCHKRNSAYRSFLHERSDKNFTIYKQHRNLATNAVRLAKRNFFIKGARSGCQFFWKHVKQCTGFGKSKSFIHPWPDVNPTAARHSACKLNSFFYDSIDKIMSKFASKSLPPTTKHTCEPADRLIFNTIQRLMSCEQ
jgi:hypothetical protein